MRRGQCKGWWIRREETLGWSRYHGLARKSHHRNSPLKSILHLRKASKIKCLKRLNGIPLRQRGSRSPNLLCSAYGARNRNLLSSMNHNLLSLQRSYRIHNSQSVKSRLNPHHSNLNLPKKTRHKLAHHTMEKCRQSRVFWKTITKQEIIYWEIRKLSGRPCFKPRNAISKHPHGWSLNQLVRVPATWTPQSIAKSTLPRPDFRITETFNHIISFYSSGGIWQSANHSEGRNFSRWIYRKAQRPRWQWIVAWAS